MFSQAQKQEFHETGFVRFPHAFSIKDALAMRDAIYSELERQCEIDRDDPSTWHSDVWPRFHDIKFDPVFEPIGGDVTRAALDELLGNWEEPSNWGQLVVSFPQSDVEWMVPHALWHTDFAYDLPIVPLPGALLISFISDVGPESGSTALLTGSHRLVAKFVESKDKGFCSKMRRVRESLMKSDPWLVDLADPDLPDREERFIKNESNVQGISLRVRELTGKTGDIVLAHPWLLHTSTLNCGESISMRRVQRIRRSGFNRDKGDKRDGIAGRGQQWRAGR